MKIVLNRIGLLRLLAACLLIIGVLSGCGDVTGSGNDSGIKVAFSTQPAELKAKQESQLVATITGLKSTTGVDVYFEVKKESDKKRTVIKLDEGSDGQGVYTAKTTFAEPVKYDVYIHVVSPDAHESVKKTVTVAP